MLPVLTNQKRQVALGTFAEIALSGDNFFGDYNQEVEPRRILIKDVAQRIFRHKNECPNALAEALYAMMTISEKAGGSFKKKKVLQFTQWLSE